MNSETGRGWPKFWEGEASLPSQTPSGRAGNQAPAQEVAETSSQEFYQCPQTQMEGGCPGPPIFNTQRF